MSNGYQFQECCGGDDGGDDGGDGHGAADDDGDLFDGDLVDGDVVSSTCISMFVRGSAIR